MSKEPVPVLVAALICDVAVADPSTNKKHLIGIFDRVWVNEFPTQWQMSLYIKLADAEGTYEIEAKYVYRKSGSEIAGAKIKLEIRDRLLTTDLHIPFPPLPIPHEGRLWLSPFLLRVPDLG